MQKQNPKLKSLNPYHNEKKIESKPREQFSFKDLIEDFDEMPFSINNQMLFSVTTKFNIMDYNKIFQKYPEKEFEVILENGQPIVDEKGEVLRDRTNPDILKYNSYISKVRIIEILRLISSNLDIPQDINEAIEILDSLGNDIFDKLQKTIQDIIIHKHTKLKERKHDRARELLALTINEKAFINEQRRSLGLPISSNKYTEPYDGRKISFGATNEYILISLAEKYNWTMEFLERALNGELTEREECLISVLKAKYELDTERESELHKELEDKNKK